MRAAPHGTAQRTGKIEAHDLRFQAQAAAATPHELTDLRGGVRAVDEDVILVPEPGRRILVAGVRAKPVLPVRADDQASRALVELHVMQLEAGKVKTVGSVAHQQGIQTTGAHQLAQAVASGSIGRVHARFLCREGREGCAGGRFPPDPPTLPKTFIQAGMAGPRLADTGHGIVRCRRARLWGQGGILAAVRPGRNGPSVGEGAWKGSRGRRSCRKTMQGHRRLSSGLGCVSGKAVDQSASLFSMDLPQKTKKPVSPQGHRP